MNDNIFSKIQRDQVEYEGNQALASIVIIVLALILFWNIFLYGFGWVLSAIIGAYTFVNSIVHDSVFFVLDIFFK